MSKKISVIIPSFNTAKTIRRCLDSILNQTYKNFEVIVVNDGSTDNSNEIINEYVKTDYRVHLYNKENGGVSSARNMGLSCVTGDYVEFVDGDDDLDPITFEYMINLIEKNDADMGVWRFNHPFFQTYIEDDVYDTTKEYDLLRYYQDTYATTMPWNKLIKRELVEGIKFDEELHFAEDEVFCLYLLKNCKKIVTTNKILYHYFLAKKEEGNEENSTINSLLNAKFWESKSSFWYIGEYCTPFRKRFLEDAMKNGQIALTHIEDMLYSRIFDYLIWETFVYFIMGVPEEAMSLEIFNVTGEESFKASAHVSDKYGLEFIEYDEKTRMQKVKEFTRYSQLATRKILDEGLVLKNGYVFHMIFAKVFYKEKGPLNDINLMCKLQLELNNNSTIEANLVNELMK